MPYVLSQLEVRVKELTNRENPITGNLELTLPDKRGVGNQICWNNARFFEYTGTNAFSRIQKGPIPQDGLRAKTRRFPTYQDLTARKTSLLHCSSVPQASHGSVAAHLSGVASLSCLAVQGVGGCTATFTRAAERERSYLKISSA